MAFKSSKAGRVYNVLILRKERVVSSEELREACKLLGVDFKTALAGLSRAGAIEPVLFKGVYYVRSPAELQLGTIQSDALDVIARACNLKLKDNWYFGLATALLLSGLWEQQHLATLTVISKERVKRYKTTFAGFTVEFKQLSCVPMDKLVKKDGVKRFSEPPRTLVDYAYFNSRNKTGAYFKAILQGVYAKTNDKERFLKKLTVLAGKYPRPYAVLIRQLVEDAVK